MQDIEYIEWHVGLDNPWFRDFSSKIYRSYRFDTSGGANSLRWELDFIKARDRKLIVSAVQHLANKYAWLTSRRNGHAEYARSQGRAPVCSDCGHLINLHVSNKGSCQVPYCDSDMGTVAASIERGNVRGSRCRKCHPYGDTLDIFLPGDRKENTSSDILQHIMSR